MATIGTRRRRATRP